MRHLRIIFLSLTLLTGNTSAFADCERRSAEAFTGKFKIKEIKNAESPCYLDEKGTIHPNQPIKVVNKGCVISLELLKITAGKMPIENKAENNIFEVYASDKKCNLKMGTTLTKKIESTANECCAIFEHEEDKRVFSCSLKPTPKLLVEPSEKYVRCSSKGSRWKIIE